jgi:hypothetical protein
MDFASNNTQARNPGITLKPLKAMDVNDTLLAQSLTMNFVWIDGRWSVQAGPLSYGYKAIDPNFTYWGANDPYSKPGELCMVYRKYEESKYFWRWFDYCCNGPFHFICQILHSCWCFIGIIAYVCQSLEFFYNRFISLMP